MKKSAWLIILLLLLQVNVYASTNTRPRSEDDLLVPGRITVTDTNRNQILNTPSVDASEKVYDFADLLSDEEESSLYNIVKNYINGTNYDLAIVTIDENNKTSSKAYAQDFYDYNEFGFDDSRSGLLMLIDMDNRNVFITTTGYAIKMYSDSRIDDIIDAGYDELKNADYALCFENMINEAMDSYNAGVPKENENLVIDGDRVYRKMSKETKAIIVFVSSSIITLIVTLIMYFQTRLKIKAGSAANYLTTDRNLNFSRRFLRSNVTRTPRPRDTGSSGSSGSSSSSGSSIHTGSSGVSHGGGGRSF